MSQAAFAEKVGLTPDKLSKSLAGCAASRRWIWR